MSEKSRYLPNIIQEATGIAEFKRIRKDHVVIKGQRKVYPIIEPTKALIRQYIFPATTAASQDVSETVKKDETFPTIKTFGYLQFAESVDFTNAIATAGVGIDLNSLIHNTKVSIGTAILTKIAVNAIIYVTRRNEESK